MAIRTAKNLWIRAGDMRGPPSARHQIEFPNDVAEFFRASERKSRTVWIRVRQRRPAWSRPLAYRGTDYGQWAEMWRLGLPTARMGGPSYAGRVIRFERVREAGNTYYRLHVSDLGSADSQSWRIASGANVGVTGGPFGREYGF